MSSEGYTAFLDRANEVPMIGGNASAQSAETKAVDTSVPASLQSIDKYYVSETDEPFMPVSLKWSGKGFPSRDEFRDLINHKAEVSIVNADEWDPRGDYVYIIRAVQEAAGANGVNVYRIHHGRSRLEYYVVSLDSESSRIVGLKARAVES